MTVSRYNIEADVVKDLHELLLAKGLTVSAAESCTGGLIGKLLTDTPGSSEYFKGSAVTYWNEAKEKVLSVHKDTLDEYTAVSEPVARQMAEGSRALYSSDIAVSTTGYAARAKENGARTQALSTSASPAPWVRKCTKSISTVPAAASATAPPKRRCTTC